MEAQPAPALPAAGSLGHSSCPVPVELTGSCWEGPGSTDKKSVAGLKRMKVGFVGEFLWVVQFSGAVS